MTSPRLIPTSDSYGIDSLAISLPQHYISLDELAVRRQIDPQKYTVGLGVIQMAVPISEEDPVTLAVEAARRAIVNAGRSPSEAGLCIVGTETPIDHAKPTAVYVHHFLGLPSTCRTFDTKNACYGGTAGVMIALDWLRSGSANGQFAIVICTDIAKYPLQSAGEPTQGAGAVALILSESPRILSIEAGQTGRHCEEVSDFWRPLHREEAISAGRTSVDAYLSALEKSYANWKMETPRTREPLARVCYHVPYSKMAYKAHVQRLWGDGFSEEVAKQTAEQYVAASVRLSSHVGNMYTGSLYLSLLSLLLAEADLLAEQRIGLFSYGSGCMAEFFAGRVSRQATKMVQQLDIPSLLSSRTKLSIDEYEALRAGKPLSTKISAGLRYMGYDEQERRVYE